MKEFVQHKLPNHLQDRNHPGAKAPAVSPYLHFGHISPVTVALAVEKADVPRPVKDAFLHQVVTWRELSVNLVHFNPNYDSFECGENWAQLVLWLRMLADPRPVLYTEAQLENAETHDTLWTQPRCRWSRPGGCTTTSACTGKEDSLWWTRSPAQAQQIAVRLR